MLQMKFLQFKLRVSLGVTLYCLASIGYAQHMFVSSRNTHEVKLYDLATGEFINNFVSAGSGGLSFPQEVLWHPDGYLLVTGRGNTAIKKYHGTTGAYLGNFTTGYQLDNPTKTTIWKDSLLYVSQWGTSQNKVVRFDIKTGAFVDEFTKTDMATGGAHAWDAAGNLYVPQWIDGLNGNVAKFDTEGNFVSTFVPATLLDGPVNLWFDTNGNLLVLDWSRGDLLEFNGNTGALISIAINTGSQLEGFAFDSKGGLFLGDWSGNKVLHYDFDTNTLTTFIETGGLVAPNSILIREVTTSIPEAQLGKARLTLAPNPAGEEVGIRYFLENTTAVHLEVVNAMGQKIATLFDGDQAAGEHMLTWNGLTNNVLRAQTGFYFVRLTVGGSTVVRQLVWQ